MFEEIIIYLFAIILSLVGIVWSTMIYSIWNYSKTAPLLDDVPKFIHDSSMVSIIIPARNESKFIKKCLDSLLKQDYPNFNIIAINDSSDDDTGEIISQYAKNNTNVVYVDAKPKPEGWVGKNWACMQGVEKTQSPLLLFTDADSVHSENVVTLAVNHLQAFELDVLTALPRMKADDFLTKITMPIISIFLHTRFSALRVNDPKKKTAYLVGGFFIIKKNIYQAVGMHEGVKNEIVEDGALGQKIKKAGYKLKMVRAEHLIQAMWARDPITLWNGIKRIVVPIYIQSARTAIAIYIGLIFLLFLPFPFLIYSVLFYSVLFDMSGYVLLLSSAFAVTSMYITCVLETVKGMGLKLRFSLLFPIGSLIVLAGMFAGLIKVRRGISLMWRGRNYDMSNVKKMQFDL